MRRFGLSKRIVPLLSSLLLAVAFSQGASAADKTITMGKYPTLKIGFTSAHFLKFLPLSLDNAKKYIDYAAEQKLAFIELRDPIASLSLKEAETLAAYATKKKLELIYAVNVGLMDPNFWEVYSRAIANAKAFGGGLIARSAANGVEFDPADKKYWTADEFAKMVQLGNKAGNLARSSGLRFFVENGREGLKGDGTTTFGFADLFGDKGFNRNVGWQLDTANFFCVSRVPADPQAVKEFLDKNAAKIGYMHLKTSVKGVCQPALGDHELSFDAYFAASAKAGMPYIAIELDATNVKTLDELKDKFGQSLKYLTKTY
jgi:sugar phosphate isomerase/epimerase